MLKVAEVGLGSGIEYIPNDPCPFHPLALWRLCSSCYLNPMVPLPQLSKSPTGSDPLNPYNGRWRQWYVDIADWMIAHPGGDMTECAKDLGRHYNTIAFITRSNIFRDYYAQRRAEYSARLDEGMRAKLTGVASKSLDVLLGKLEKQGDALPLKFVTELATSTLDRLGYAPNTPGTVVSIDQSDRRTVQVAVNAGALEEAREAMRAAEEKRAIESRLAAARVVLPGDAVPAGGAGSSPDGVLDLMADGGDGV
jgi:hypothetical protein